MPKIAWNCKPTGQNKEKTEKNQEKFFVGGKDSKRCVMYVT
jgi:hypothetical protein